MCLNLNRHYAGSINVPTDPNEWPELFRPGSEQAWLERRAKPRHHRERLR